MRSTLWHPSKPCQFITTVFLAAISLSCQTESTTWESHWEKANLLFERSDFVGAEAELKSALRAAEMSEAQGKNVALSLVGLGILYDAQRQFEKAQTCFERALRILEISQGPDHPDLITPLHSLGALHAIQHQFDKALPYFERAFSIQEHNFGPAHPLIREHLKYFAAVVVARAQYQEAEPFLARELVVTKTPPGTIDREAAEALDNYERLSTAQDEYNKAKPYLEEFDRVDNRPLPTNLHEMSASLDRLAQLLSTQDNFEKFEKQLRRATEKAAETHKPTSIEVSQRLADLAYLYWAWGKIDVALPLLERSVSITNGPHGNNAAGNRSQGITEIQQKYLTALRSASHAALKKQGGKGS